MEPTDFRPGGPPSERVRVAEAARDAALGVEGVAAVGSGPFEPATWGGTERVRGVVVAEDGSLTLHIDVRPVSIPALAERVRAAVGVATGHEPSSISIVVEDLVLDREAGE
jgi:uncharacterized alkaline shock family protein YloU